MIHSWVLKLRLPLLLIFLLKGNRRRVFTAEVSPLAARLLALLERFGVTPVTVERITPHIGFTNTAGETLTYALENRLAHLSNFLPLTQDGDRWLPADMRPYTAQWNALLRAELVDNAREELVLPIFAEAAYAKGEVPGTPAQVECWISPKAHGSFVTRHCPFAPGFPARLRLLPSGPQLIKLLHIVPGHPKFWLLRIVDGMFGRWAPPQMEATPEALRQGVILEQAYIPSFERYPSAGHLYWIDESGIDPQRIMLLCNRTDGLYADVLPHAHRMGFAIADANPICNQLQRPIRTILNCLWRSRHAIFRAPNRFSLWRWHTLLHHLILVESYETLFTRVNAHALHHANNFTSHTAAMLIALKRHGGLFFYNQWSVYMRLVALEATAWIDLALAWGPFNRGHLAANGHTYRRLVEVGMVGGDGYDNNDHKRAEDIRAQFAPGIRFVITLFDASNDYSSHSRLQHVQDFYRATLAEVEAHPDWGCLIKTKGVTLQKLPQTPGIQDAITRLETQGRCIVLAGWERVSVAALAGDLSVSSTINSAGFEAALAGKRSIHLDLAGLVHHPVRLAGLDGRAVFDTLETYVDALRCAAGGDSTVGDYGTWLDTIDRFGDGRGRFRVGALLARYLANRDAGLDRDAATDEAVEDYARTWGEQYVHRAEDGPDTNDETGQWKKSKRLAHPDWPFGA